MEYTSRQFWCLKDQRQELVYQRWLSYKCSTVQSIDDLLAQIARKSQVAFIVDFLELDDTHGKHKLDTMNRWIRFYQSPRFMRHVLEKLNQILGYRGESWAI
jgi:phosphopantetheine adenylyltransferase